MHSCRASVLLGWGSCGGILQITGVLWWTDTGSLIRPGREGEERELPFMWEQQDSTGLCFGMGGEPVKSRQVRISWQTSVGGTVVAVCYRVPDQEEDEAFRQLEKNSCSQAQVLMGNFNHLWSAGRASQQGTWNPGGFWSSGVATGNLKQVIEQLERWDTLLDLILTKKN